MYNENKNKKFIHESIDEYSYKRKEEGMDKERVMDKFGDEMNDAKKERVEMEKYWEFEELMGEPVDWEDGESI